MAISMSLRRALFPIKIGIGRETLLRVNDWIVEFLIIDAAGFLEENPADLKPGSFSRAFVVKHF
jgi:hypothetical protein